MGAQDVQSLLNAGPYGLAALFAVVIAFLYWRLSAKDEEIKALNEKRADLAGRVEATIATTKAAIEKLTSSIEDTADASDERFETIRAMQNQLVALAQLVAGNRDTLSKIEGDLLRELIGRVRS